MGRAAAAARQLAAGLCVAAFMTFGTNAGDLAKGDTFEVRPRSIWFEDADKLQKWQQLKTLGDMAALTAHERNLLAERGAWQFTGVLKVRVLEHDRSLRQLKVEMLTAGRLSGSTWFLDEGAWLH